MRKSWKDHFKPGTKERESFDDMAKMLEQGQDPFPVGSLYVTTDPRNPSEVLGYGVWELIIVTGGD